MRIHEVLYHDRACVTNRCNRVEAVLAPSAPGRAVSAVKLKNTLHGPCHKKTGSPHWQKTGLLRTYQLLVTGFSLACQSLITGLSIFAPASIPHLRPEASVSLIVTGVDPRDCGHCGNDTCKYSDQGHHANRRNSYYYSNTHLDPSCSRAALSLSGIAGPLFPVTRCTACGFVT